MVTDWLKTFVDEQGWQRVKAMWDIHEPSLEVEYLPTIVLSSSITTFFLAGLVGARQTAENFIKNNSMTMFPSKVQAQREMHSHALLGFVRHGCRAGWRACAFAVTFTLLSGSLNTYFNKIHVLHYTAAGSAAGVLLKVRQGPHGLFFGLLVGAAISLPVGLGVQGFHAILPQEYFNSVEEEKLQKRKERDEEWRHRLDALDRMIYSMKTDSSSSDLSMNEERDTDGQESQKAIATKDDKEK